jgi:hypothetical protein
MRERSGRQDVPERSVPNGLARRASAANATNRSGGEAEIAGGVKMRRGAATRSLRSARGAAHSGAARHAVGGEEGYDLIGQKDLVAGEFENFKRECKQMRLLANCDRCEA